MKVSWIPTPVALLAMSITPPAFAQQYPEREGYFGEMQGHTNWLLDFCLKFNNTLVGPKECYTSSLGQPITHPGGFTVKITKPLDWGATTEHAEYLGTVQHKKTYSTSEVRMKVRLADRVGVEVIRDITHRGMLLFLNYQK